jgi:hypothetical protein
MPKYEIVGWIWGKDAKQPEWLYTPNPEQEPYWVPASDLEPAYWVPESALEPIEELCQLIEQQREESGRWREA